jgi:hypothetical protein
MLKAWHTHGNTPHGGADFYPLLAKVGKHAFPMLKTPSTTPHHILCSFPSHAPGASYILDCLATALRRHGAEKTHSTVITGQNVSQNHR